MTQTVRTEAASTGFSSRAAGLSINSLDVSYGDHRVLNHVDLEIRPGEFFALLGPSGCGKTTLLRAIAGFSPIDAGHIRVDGRDISSLPPWKRDVGMVFQSYALWPHMTVARNVAFGLEERAVARSEVQRRVTAALDLVGMSALANRRPSQLSGGQQQRVALARTVVVEPQILLLDEPLSNLDAKLRVQVRRELRELQQRLGLTTILVTHDQEEANTICDRIAVMNEGRILQTGSPAEIYQNPNSRFVANFLGSANFLEGKVVGAGSQRAFQSDAGFSVPLPAETTAVERMSMFFRPQDASLVGSGVAQLGHVQTAGTITFREFLGSSVRYNIKAGAADLLVEVPFHPGDQVLEVGRTITASVPTSAFRRIA